MLIRRVYIAHNFCYNSMRTNLIINDSPLNKMRFRIFASKLRVVARNNRPGRTKRRAIAAISQGMNTEIDSANAAMMVERKARYGT